MDTEKIIREEILVDASVDKVFDAWTTEQGIKTFFASACKIDFRILGKCEIYFDTEAPAGSKGSEDCMILSFQKNKMLSFTWNAPPHLPSIRNQKTYVLIRFYNLEENKTRVVITHIGWGEGGEWDEAFNYFEHAWKNIVLKRLQYAFAHGHVNWDNPQQF